MNSLRLKGKIGGAMIALAILFGVGIASSSTAQAQRNDRDWRNNRNDRNRDWRNDRNRDSNRDRDWSRDRNRNGVDDRSERNNGYGNNGRYGGNGGYGGNSSAMNQGYQDGLYTGSNDGQRGQSYNPQRSHFWREANGNSGYGNRGQSAQTYRQGFLRGYEAGYRQYGGNYGNGRGNSRNRSGNILGQIFGRP